MAVRRTDGEGVKTKTKTSVMSNAHIISTYLCLFIIILYLYIWVQPASHHLYTNLHIKLRRIAHLLQNPAHHLHTLIPVKAPAHEQVICGGEHCSYDNP